MPTLDVFKERRSSVIKLGDKELRIPNEYTVEETERLLELGRQRERLEAEAVLPKDKDAQVERFWALVFDQLEVLVQHHQPDMTAEDMRKLVTHKEALEILGFHDKYRLLQKKQGQDGDDSKKKSLVTVN